MSSPPSSLPRSSKGSTWARNPVPRIHTDNIGMAFVGGCWGQNGPPGEVCTRNKQTKTKKVIVSKMHLQLCAAMVAPQVCRQAGAPWCPDKEDCSNFPTPCPDIDNGW